MSGTASNVIEAKWMGDKWFGVDVDTIFAYQTPRVAIIKDRSLGLIKNLLMLAIFGYIFVFNIWFKGAHFKHAQVNGVARLQWQEPTKKCNPFHVDCKSNYASAAELPYCSQYKGSHPLRVRRDCEYYDARELPMNILQGVLIPTFINEYKQARECPPESPTCDRKWEYVNEDGTPQSGKGPAKPTSQTFVADVNDFTVLIDHSIRTSNGQFQMGNGEWRTGLDDYDMRGWWSQCDSEKGTCEKAKRITCVQCKDKYRPLKKKSRFLSFVHNRKDASPELLNRPKGKLIADKMRSTARLAPDADNSGFGEIADDDDDDDNFADALQFSAEAGQEEAKGPEVIAIKVGDVISLKSMLQMAGKSLDDITENDQGEYESIRLRGAGIIIQIMYGNLMPWTLFRPNDPWYTITVSTMKSPKFKHAVVKTDSESHRDLQVNYGSYIVVKQMGSLAYFDAIFALIALSSAFGLLAVSNLLTDLIMLKALPRKEEYKSFKYMESEDFNEDVGVAKEDKS